MLIGDIIQSPRPADYADGAAAMMLCNGRAINRIAYADLFTLCGVAFGAGDGVTTFNIPRFTGLNPVDTGRTPMGASPAGGHALGATGGQYFHGHTFNVGTIPHLWPANPVNAAPTVNVAAGAVQVAAGGHVHGMAGPPPPNDHAIPAPMDSGDITTPSLAMYFFIRVL